MRPGYKYLDVPRGTRVRGTADATPEEFSESMGYERQRFATPEEFLSHHDADWVLELHAALRDLLRPEAEVLSVGSGAGEHEVRFHLLGYRVTASDVTVEALERTARLFPGFQWRRFDAFDPDRSILYEDVLVTGLDFYFDDRRASQLFHNLRSVLRPRGRLLFTLRYHDRVATRAVDLAQAWAARRRARGYRRRNEPMEVRRKLHGYRRTPREIVRMAEGAGFRLGRVRHAGYGAELLRLHLNVMAPRVFQIARRIDRRLHQFHNATVFEFLT